MTALNFPSGFTGTLILWSATLVIAVTEGMKQAIYILHETQFDCKVSNQLGPRKDGTGNVSSVGLVSDLHQPHIISIEKPVNSS